MKKTFSLIIALILIAFGCTRFFDESSNNKEVPLSDVSNFVVDSSGLIYIATQFYERIQVYDNNGKFIQNWNVPTAGAFDISLDTAENILAFVVRGNEQYKFDHNGKILSSRNGLNPKAGKSSKIFINKKNQIYKLRGFFCNQIVRQSPSSKVIVKQNIWFLLKKAPILGWLLCACGMFWIYRLLDLHRIHTTHNSA